MASLFFISLENSSGVPNLELLAVGVVGFMSLHFCKKRFRDASGG